MDDAFAFDKETFDRLYNELTLRAVLFSSYFVFLIAVIALICHKISQKWRAYTYLLSKKNEGGIPFILFCYFPFALLSAVICWKNILEYLGTEMNTKFKGDFQQFIHNTQFFLEAYRDVSDTPQRWWWSSQLLAFVLTWVVFLYTASKRNGSSTGSVFFDSHKTVWLYFSLGFFGAISTASFLFFADLFLTYEIRRMKTSGPGQNPYANIYKYYLKTFHVPFSRTLALCIAAATASVCIFPSLAGAPSVFELNTFVLHVSLFLPALHFIFAKCDAGTSSGDEIHLMRTYTTFEVLKSVDGVSDANLSVDGLKKITIAALNSLFTPSVWNLCQTSITADVFFTGIAILFFMISESGMFGLVFWFLTVPTGGIGVSFPLFLAIREGLLLEKYMLTKYKVKVM
eukprot:Nk52_evm10s2640 gene=Nk52_evmTU10s2640